jgi:hypothetical protein
MDVGPFYLARYPMTVTDEAIENLANSFCLLSNPEHKALYVEALKSIARIAQGELIFRMELTSHQATQATKH